MNYMSNSGRMMELDFHISKKSESGLSSDDILAGAARPEDEGNLLETSFNPYLQDRLIKGNIRQVKKAQTTF